MLVLLSLHIQIAVNNCSRSGTFTGGLKYLRLKEYIPPFHSYFIVKKKSSFYKFWQWIWPMATSVATQIYSKPEQPKLISSKIFLNKWLLQTFFYLEIRFVPFKMECRVWKRCKHQKCPKKHHFWNMIS